MAAIIIILRLRCTLSIRAVLINHALQNLKDGFEVLSNLLMHEYAAFRGFALASFESEADAADPTTTWKVSQADRAKDNTDDSNREAAEEEEEDEARLLRDSQKQLLALAQLKTGDATADSIVDLTPSMPQTDVLLRTEGDLGSFKLYDSLLTDVLARLSDKGIKETYVSCHMLSYPVNIVLSILTCHLPFSATCPLI